MRKDELTDRVKELGEKLGLPMDDVLGALDGAMLGTAVQEAQRYCDEVAGADTNGDPKPGQLLMQIELADGSSVPVVGIMADGGYINFTPKVPLRKEQ